jgi:hypothetical protein
VNRIIRNIFNKIAYYIIPKLFLILNCDEWCGGVVMSPSEAIDIIAAEISATENEMSNYSLNYVWMTEYKKEKLPEFEG